jgi:hypothetical protein
MPRKPKAAESSKTDTLSLRGTRMKAGSPNASRRQFVPILGLLLGVTLSGCIPHPGSSRYFQHNLEMSIDGQQTLLQHNYKCYKSADLSEGDGSFHTRSHQSGQGITTTDIGKGRALIYRISGDCLWDNQSIGSTSRNLESPVALLFRTRIPAELDVIGAKSKLAPAKLLGQYTVRKDYFLVEVGPTDDENHLRNVLRAEQHGFERVTAVALPIEIWGVTPQAKQYFSNLHRVTVAAVGEDPPISGNSSEIVQFRYFAARDLPKSAGGGYSAMRELGTEYDGHTFVLETVNTDFERWFATEPSTRWPRATLVRFKGVTFELAQVREVYDPSTQTILRFSRHYIPYAWGDGDLTDEMTKRQ